MQKNSKIYIAGHNGLVGSAILNALKNKGYNNFVFTPRQQVDLVNQQAVSDFFAKEKPEYVFLAAAKVGGIVANNTYRAQFIYENLQIQNNIIHQSWVHGVKKLLFLGSSCIYPRECKQPMKEEYLLTTILEYTNEPYAIAKIAGIKTCESYNLQYGTNYISVMPTNLYGYNDNFDLEKSHVLPAMIRKMHLGKCLSENNWPAIREDFNRNPVEGINGNNTEAEILSVLQKYGIKPGTPVNVELWGTGKPRREFLHANDAAEACVYLMENIDFNDIVKQEFGISNLRTPVTIPDIRNTHINIGTGEDITIMELADLIKEIVGFTGNIVWNTEKPDGTLRKLLDVEKIKKLGWTHSIELKQGITDAYLDYIK